MNTKHSFWNRLFAALLLAVMLVTQTTTAFAVEDSPEPTEPSMVQAQDSDTGTEEAGEGTDTPEGGSLSEGPETALQTVSSLEELLQAIEQAEAGATITTSACFARATCSPLNSKLRSNVSTRHLFPVRLSNVMGLMKLVAFSVRSTCTFTPCFTSMLARPAIL